MSEGNQRSNVLSSLLATDSGAFCIIAGQSLKALWMVVPVFVLAVIVDDALEFVGAR
jgi:hypothetical protein